MPINNLRVLRCVLTQVVLVTVAGLVGVRESGIKWGRPVVLDLLLNTIRHLYSFKSTSNLCCNEAQNGVMYRCSRLIMQVSRD